MQAWSQELAPRPGLPHSLVGYLEAGTPCLRKPVGADGVWSPVSPRQRGRGAVTAGCGATPASKTQLAGMGPSWCPQGLCGQQQGAGGGGAHARAGPEIKAIKAGQGQLAATAPTQGGQD